MEGLLSGVETGRCWRTAAGTALSRSRPPRCRIYLSRHARSSARHRWRQRFAVPWVPAGSRLRRRKTALAGCGSACVEWGIDNVAVAGRHSDDESPLRIDRDAGLVAVADARIDDRDALCDMLGVPRNTTCSNRRCRTDPRDAPRRLLSKAQARRDASLVATEGRFPTELSDICRFPAPAPVAEYRFCWKSDVDANHAARASFTGAIRAGPCFGTMRVCYVRSCRRDARGMEP